MKVVCFLVFITMLSSACSSNTEEHSNEDRTEVDTQQTTVQHEAVIPEEVDSLNNVAESEDTITEPQVEKTVKQEKTKPQRDEPAMPQTRIYSYVSDESCNGEPVWIQMDLARKIYYDNPDTLKQIAKEDYRANKDYFPVSISDNFEEMKSTEHIGYCDITFKYQLFDNEFSDTPYTTAFIKVKRLKNGTLVTD